MNVCIVEMGMCIFIRACHQELQPVVECNLYSLRHSHLVSVLSGKKSPRLE